MNNNVSCISFGRSTRNWGDKGIKSSGNKLLRERRIQPKPNYMYGLNKDETAIYMLEDVKVNIGQAFVDLKGKSLKEIKKIMSGI